MIADQLLIRLGLEVTMILLRILILFCVHLGLSDEWYLE